MGGPVLAFDTSGSVGSVVIGVPEDGQAVLSSVSIEERFEQAARLVPAIDQALQAAGLEGAAIAGILVGEGPGSFTGVRVAAATAKGLAHAWGLPLWALSSLAGAALANDAGPVRYVLFDARADRVYGACYGVGGAGMQKLVPPHGGTLRDVLAADVPAGAVFLGEGARRHRAVIEGAGYPVVTSAGERTIAEGLLRCLALGPHAEPAVDSGSWEPTYVRAWSEEPPWSA